jgi:hypothetical protein
MHRPTPKHEVISSGVAILRVGEWVEVEHDFSPGHNSGGGVGIIMAVTNDHCEVKYVVSGCYERFVPARRLTTIPMPFKENKSELRERRPTRYTFTSDLMPLGLDLQMLTPTQDNIG